KIFTLLAAVDSDKLIKRSTATECTLTATLKHDNLYIFFGSCLSDGLGQLIQQPAWHGIAFGMIKFNCCDVMVDIRGNFSVFRHGRILFKLGSCYLRAISR